MKPASRLSWNARLRRVAGGPVLIAIALLLAASIVDPFREFSPQDDGWAYARSVEHLLSQGQYRLDPWAAANMPVQIYFGAGLSQLFGYSFSVLRISTLLLLALGLASFFALLREFGIDARLTTVLTLALLANPLVLMLSFTFMSDIQFLGWLMAALWLYVRGFRRGSDLSLLCGSVAAVCAIGTRQFGMALLPALLLPLLMTGAEARPPWRRTFLALALPSAVALWQLASGLDAPNATQQFRLATQSYFLSRPPRTLVKELAWRVATIWQYIGMMLLAVAPLLLSRMPELWRRGRTAAITMTAVAAVLIGLTRLNSSLTARDSGDLSLPLWWMLPNAFFDQPVLMKGLDVAGLAVAVLLAWWLVGERRIIQRLVAKPERVLVAATALGLFVLHLVYVQLNDTYIVGFLPFALLLLAACLHGKAVGGAWLRSCVVISLAIIVAQSLWLRGEFNLQQAQWQAANRLLAAGVPVPCIAGTKHWNEYHGAFDVWLAQTHGKPFDASVRSGADPLHAPFYEWLAERERRAHYHVSQPRYTTPPAGWILRDEFRYRDALFRSRVIHVYERPSASDVAAPDCPA